MQCPKIFWRLLDGIYRVHLGQIVHRDFSSPSLARLTLLYLRLLCRCNAGIISSLNYSEAAYVVIAFFIYLYIQLTRLDRMAGFFLGVWIPLALLARMNFGDPLEFVTEAMQYNRRCDVFLLLLLLLFIPARESNRRYLIIDGVLYGAISAFLFYSKITFGLVALAFAPIMLVRKRDNVIVIAVAAVIFLAIAAWVEIVYGMRFAWMTDVKMAGASVARDQFGRILHVLRDNTTRIVWSLAYSCVHIAALAKAYYIARVVLRLRRGRVGVNCLLQRSILRSRPYLLLLCSSRWMHLSQSRLRGINEQIRTRYVLLSALASTLLVIESYPLAVNIAISTYRAIHAAPWDSTNES